MLQAMLPNPLAPDPHSRCQSRTHRLRPLHLTASELCSISIHTASSTTHHPPFKGKEVQRKAKPRENLIAYHSVLYQAAIALSNNKPPNPRTIYTPPHECRPSTPRGVESLGRARINPLDPRPLSVADGRRSIGKCQTYELRVDVYTLSASPYPASPAQLYDQDARKSIRFRVTPLSWASGTEQVDVNEACKRTCRCYTVE